MKKILFAIVASAMVIVACNKEQLPFEQSISVTDLSKNVSSYVAENYPDATIAEALVVKENQPVTIVILNTNEQLAFNEAGLYLGEGLNYRGGRGGGRGGNHGGGHHHGGGPGGHHGGGPGGHHGGGPGGHHGGGCHQGIDSTTLDSLLPGAQAFIDSNYAGYSVIGARRDSTCQYGAVINVMISNRSFTGPVKITFDLAGNFLMSSVRYSYANAPQLVKDYITNNYAGYNVRNKAEQSTLANASIQYNVFVADTVNRYLVTVKDDGTLVCVK
jgi:hypothetical protein